MYIYIYIIYTISPLSCSLAGGEGGREKAAYLFTYALTPAFGGLAQGKERVCERDSRSRNAILFSIFFFLFAPAWWDLWVRWPRGADAHAVVDAGRVCFRVEH